MKDKALLLKELTGKNEAAAQKAADYLIDTADIELFKMLADKSDYLFPFVRNNVMLRIEKAVTKSNFSNILSFFDYYSPYYEDLFASLLAKHANEELTDKILELLDKGTNDQKIYSAKYFSYIPDTAALEILSRYAFSDDENLCAAAAEALGQMRDDVSYDIALDMVETGDDFDKLKAVRFFSAYGRNFPLKEVFKVLETSGMPENTAGLLPYAVNLYDLIETEYKDGVLKTVYYIISGLGEILPLSEIFRFDLYRILEKLINVNEKQNEYEAEIAAVLLSARGKLKMLNENEEYIFDEDKDTKYELKSMLELLEGAGSDFWSLQKKFILEFLKGGSSKISAALQIISEYNIQEAGEDLKKLISAEDEAVVLSVLNTLKSLNRLEDIDLKKAAEKIKNPNIKAEIENIGEF